MPRNEILPHIEKSYSKLPVKIPHAKYKEGKRYTGSCAKDYGVFFAEERSRHLEPKNDVQCNSSRSQLDATDKSTQINFKNFYDSRDIKHLVNTNTDIATNDNSTNNANNLIDDTDPLSDIKNILLRTNDKLDIILSTLDKKDLFSNILRKDQANRHRRHKSNKHRSRLENSRSSLQLSQSFERDDQLPELTTSAYSWSKCMSSTSITRMRSNPYFMSPYFPPYYVKPISHFNYFKIFGPKYSDPDMTSNLWSPFMFMATSFNVNNIQQAIKNDSLNCLESGKSKPTNSEMKGIAVDLDQRTEIVDEIGVQAEFSEDLRKFDYGIDKFINNNGAKTECCINQKLAAEIEENLQLQS